MAFNLKKLLGLVDPEPEPTRQDVAQQPVQPAATTGLPAAPQKRREIIGFIMDSLRPYRDEANTDIIGLHLYVFCPAIDDEELVNVALYSTTPDRFKEEELARELANHYIRLPKNWTFAVTTVRDVLPDCRFKQGALGLSLIRPTQEVTNQSVATVSMLVGQTAQEEYVLDPSQKQTYLIGRGKKPSLPSGRVRTNDIAFLEKGDPQFDPEQGEVNASVSRNHAKITYDSARRGFFLYAEDGGLPTSGNKTKILKVDDSVVRVDILGMGYPLADGDQIELGGDAKLLIRIQ